MVVIILLLSSKDLKEDVVCYFYLTFVFVPVSDSSRVQFRAAPPTLHLCSHKPFGSNENVSKLSVKCEQNECERKLTRCGFVVSQALY